MAVSVRSARTADAADVAHLTAQLGYDVDARELRERLARILERTDQRFMIAEFEGSPVGWLHAAIWEFVETEAFVVIAGLVVDRRYRRQGIGAALMAQAERWALEQGCRVVRLWSSAGRTEAHAFYERLGYTRIKSQFAFARALDPVRRNDLQKFVPRLEG
jgi:GNAT superfamily N-acetyltransferase